MACSRGALDDPSERRDTRAADQLQVTVRRRDGGATAVGERAPVTRARLLERAEKLFADGGFLATELAHTAKCAGGRVPTVHQYFADRSDVVAALAGESARRMRDVVLAG